MAEGTSNIDVPKVVKFLNRSFQAAQEKAMQSVGRDNTRDPKTKKCSPLYEFQVEYCYLIDEITRGPTYIVPKRIQEANTLIAELEGL